MNVTNWQFKLIDILEKLDIIRFLMHLLFYYSNTIVIMDLCKYML